MGKAPGMGSGEGGEGFLGTNKQRRRSHKSVHLLNLALYGYRFKSGNSCKSGQVAGGPMAGIDGARAPTRN